MKIGWVGGTDQTFADAVGARLAAADAGVRFEQLTFGSPDADPGTFAAVFDGVSGRVPFVRSLLFSWAEMGVKVVNDPRAVAAGDRASALARLGAAGLPVPRHRVLPNKRFDERVPPGAFRHLEYPWPFGRDLAALGGRAFLSAVHAEAPLVPTFVESESELLAVFDRTGSDLTMLTEVVPFDRCVRVFVVGGRDALWARFDPAYAAYLVDPAYLGPDLEERVVRLAVTASQHLGLDLNAVDVAIDGDRLVLLDPYRPQPDVSAANLPPFYFNKLVPAVAELLLARARGEGQVFATAREPVAASETESASDDSQPAATEARTAAPAPLEVQVPPPAASVVVKAADVARALLRGHRERPRPGSRESGERPLEAGQE